MSGVDLVIQGGGSNVVGLASAAYELQRSRSIQRAAGTSAGALAALAIAYRVDEGRLRSVLEHALANNRLLDGDIGCFLSRYGWCRGDVLRATARNLVGEGARLGDAPIPVAVVVGDLYTRAPRVLSSWATPDVLVEDAATATAAIPGVFAAQTIRGLGVGFRLHVDGGVSMNFALDLFDDQPNVPTIGIRPAPERRRLEPVKDLRAYLWAIAGLRQWAADNAYRSGKQLVRIVDVQGGDGLDFSLSAADIQQRWDAGIEAMRRAQLEA